VVSLLAAQYGCNGRAADGLTANTGAGTSENYCDQFPEDAEFCGDLAQTVDSDEVLARVAAEQSPPPGAFLVSIQGGDLAPDGRQMSADGAWELIYAVPQSAPILVTFDPGQSMMARLGPSWQCEPTDAIGFEGFQAEVQRATLKLQDEIGAMYEPGTFFLTARRQAGCVFVGGYDVTLVTSFTDRPQTARLTVEISAQHPEGVVCDQSPDTGCLGR
jgi:hypothetical protein